MYSRGGNENKRVIIQPRDRRFVEELALLRIVDREQAKIIAGFGSTTRVNTRLLALTRAGFLRRFFLGTDAGGKKALYAVSPKGAELAGVPYRGIRRRNHELLTADSLVPHQLAVSDIYCRLKKETSSALDTTLVRWLTFREPLTPTLRLIPDAYFELTTASGIVTSFVEVDLGHEHLAIWRKKVENYLHLAISGEYKRMFGQQRFRVLTVVNSRRRLVGIRKAARTSTYKIFWFTDFASVERHGLFGSLWFRPMGDDKTSFFSSTL